MIQKCYFCDNNAWSEVITSVSMDQKEQVPKFNYNFVCEYHISNIRWAPIPKLGPVLLETPREPEILQ